MMGINFFRRFEGQMNDHAAHAHGLAFYDNESVAQPESSKTAGISDMTLGPVGGNPHFGEIEAVSNVESSSEQRPLPLSFLIRKTR